MSSSIDNGLDSLLMDSLESAFEPSPAIPKNVPSANSSGATEPPPPIPSPVDIGTTESEIENSQSQFEGSEAWKDDYEKYLSFWKHESSLARQKAEETRAMWETRREEERRDGKERKYDWESLVEKPGHPSESGAVQVVDDGEIDDGAKAKHRRKSTSPIDGRDFVPGAEAERGTGKETLESTLPPISQPNPPYPKTLNNPGQPSSSHSPDSWDKINTRSLESSFPDISFSTHPPSPTLSQPDGNNPSASTFKKEEMPAPAPVPHPPSATLSIFSPSATTKTRLLALTSSLAINFLLPFINGIMLGFGEIFARNIVAWFGWTPSSDLRSRLGLRNANTATAIGIGAVGEKRREDIARKSSEI